MSDHVLETEVTIYAKIGDMNGFKAAISSENQVQLTSQFKKGGKCRVRKTEKNGHTTFVYTIKKPPAVKGSIAVVQKEFNVEVNEEFFENFFSGGAEDMCHKTRYVFNPKNVTLRITDQEKSKDFKITVPVLKYEVDVFVKPDGTHSDWCKIDIELDSVQRYLKEHHPDIKKFKTNFKISTLPFKPEAPLLVGAKNFDHKFVDDLWKTEFSKQLVG